MAPRTRRRNSIRAPAPGSPTVVTLPTDLLLEVVARSDFSTVVRCAATCKFLRQDIFGKFLRPFIQRITQQTAPCIVVDMCDYGRKPLTLLHPATPAAATFCQDQLSPFMLRRMAKLLRKYRPEMSRGGLVVLRSIDDMQPKSHTCVYNPMTGHCAYLSKPPDVKSISSCFWESVLLTAADGISCSFMLLFAYLYTGIMKVHTATSLSSTWESVTCSSNTRCGYRSHVVLHGGIIHWLADNNDHILTYNVGTRTLELMELPLTNDHVWSLQLATSREGNLLKLLAMEGFKIYVWLQLPLDSAHGGGGGGNWSLQNILDTEEKLRSMCPDMPRNVTVYFESYENRSGDVRLLQVKGKISYRGKICFMSS